MLIFLSQFILGIGNTLYYSLGQSYLDDNTKKTNTPMMLGYAFSLRMVGPMLGFVLSYGFLNMYIDPSKTPIITSNDPRWMGAWWLGWIVLGVAMILFAFLVGLFPRNMPKSKKDQQAGWAAIEGNSLYDEEGKEALMTEVNSNKKTAFAEMEREEPPAKVKAKMKDFPRALKRLLKNKLLMFNIFSGIFYILGMGGFMTFMSKYLEVQFNKTKADSTIIAGPLNIFGMVIGLLGSGWYISKKKPGASRLLFWNVIIGVLYMVGQFSYLFLSCSDDNTPLADASGRFDLTTECNTNCQCSSVPFNPVCDPTTGQTFFSACHAGCKSWDAKGQVYTNCSCSSPLTRADPYSFYTTQIEETTTTSEDLLQDDIVTETTVPSRRRRNAAVDSVLQRIKTMVVTPGACGKGCQQAFLVFTLVSSIINT